MMVGCGVRRLYRARIFIVNGQAENRVTDNGCEVVRSEPCCTGLTVPTERSRPFQHLHDCRLRQLGACGLSRFVFFVFALVVLWPRLSRSRGHRGGDEQACRRTRRRHVHPGSSSCLAPPGARSRSRAGSPTSVEAESSLARYSAIQPGLHPGRRAVSLRSTKRSNGGDAWVRFLEGLMGAAMSATVALTAWTLVPSLSACGRSKHAIL